MKYSTMTTPQLREQIAKLSGDAAERVRKVCAILGELDMRKESHELMNRGVFRFYRFVNAGELSPSALLGCRANAETIDVLRRMPLDRQDAYTVGGEKVRIIRYGADNTLSMRSESFRTLSISDLGLAFSDTGKPRSEHGQRVKVGKGKGVTRRTSSNETRITADTKNGDLIVGRSRVTPQDIAPALKELGFELVRKK